MEKNAISGLVDKEKEEGIAEKRITEGFERKEEADDVKERSR